MEISSNHNVMCVPNFLGGNNCKWSLQRLGRGKLTSLCIQNVDISLNGHFTMLTEFHSSIAFGTRSSSGLVLN